MNRSFVTSVVLALALNAAGFAARAQPTYTLTQIEPSRPDAFAIEIADLNDKGEVVGEILTDSGRLGFVWHDGEMTIITGLSTGSGSLALPTAINNRSDRLDDLISEDDPLEPVVRLEIARWINNRGQIVALGQNSQNPLEGRVAYLLTPTP